MKALDADWKLGGFELLASVVPDNGETEVFLDEILEQGGWRQNALFELVGMAFPKVDLASLKNGISATQLGEMAGQVHSNLNRLGTIFEAIQKAFRRYFDSAENVRRLLDQYENRVAPQERERWESLRSVATAPLEFPQISRAHVRELVLIKSRYRRAISKVVELASKQGGREAEQFFAAYSKALSAPALDDSGHFSTADRRVSGIISVLFLCGDELTRGLTSVTEFHRVLAQMMPSQLTRDEDSLEWISQRKVVERICRTLELKFRGRGRPPKSNP